MGSEVCFTVPGKPVGKGRPRFTKQGRTYTPGKTKSYEAEIKFFAERAMQGNPPLDGPLEVFIEAKFAKPKSWSKKKKTATYYHTSKPDADNIAKVMDALDGLVWVDDKQVAKMHITKIYSDNGSEHLKVEIHNLEGEYL